MEDSIRSRKLALTRSRWLIALTICATLQIVTATSTSARPTSSADVVAIATAIEIGNRNYVAALEASDAHRFANIFLDDALSLPPSGLPIRGRSEIESSMVAAFKRVRFTDGTMHSIETRIMGDTVVEIGTYRLSVVVDGHPSILSGRYLTVWRRIDGVWKIAIDSSQPGPMDLNGAPASATPAT